MTVTAYPLTWPTGLPRTERQVNSAFKTTLDPALKNVGNSLRRFGEATGKAVSNIVISSNYTLGVQRPADAGVAVWFLWDGSERCIAVDRYPKLEHNLQAIHHILEARITEARHGGLRIVQQTFTGFIALPAPLSDGKNCWQVLDIPPNSTAQRIKEAHRELARKLHPDARGSSEDMAALNAARDQALLLVGAS